MSSISLRPAGSRAARVIAPGRSITINGRGRRASVLVATGSHREPRVDLTAPTRAVIALRPLEATTIAKEGGIQVTVGRQGPAGISGVDGAGDFEAGETIGGHRAVYFDGAGKLRKATSETGGNAAVAIIRNAATAGAQTKIYKDGSVNGFSGLTPGARYFLGTDGVITETPPTSGIYQALGTAASATILIVEIGEPVYQ